VEAIGAEAVDEIAASTSLFTSDERWSKEIDTWIGKANAVLCELYHSVVTKEELLNTTKLSVFKAVFVLILSFGHES